jgi:hypothetical protein
VIANNNILESTHDADRCGLYIVASTTGQWVSITDNVITGAAGTKNPGAGIYVADIFDISISGNIVQWTGASGAGAGVGIFLDNCLGGNISGNYVQPDDGTSAEILSSGTSGRLYAVANNVGNSIDNGVITLGGSGGNNTVSTENKTA